MLQKRLLILKAFIILEDKEGINFAIDRLKTEFNNNLILSIISFINERKYADAINEIDVFISSQNNISIWVDEEVIALKFELKELEIHYEILDGEIIEIQKIILDFEHRNSIELGEIILEILKLRKQKFKAGEIKYEEANNDYQHYQEQFNKEIAKEHYDLNDAEFQELKTKFRKASILCHPDKVNDELKEAAQALFIELKTAYEANDLKRVSDILKQLQQDNLFKSKSEAISEKEKLLYFIRELKRKISEIDLEINTIKESETFATIIAITDFDDYFRKTKETLLHELNRLQITCDN